MACDRHRDRPPLALHRPHCCPAPRQDKARVGSGRRWRCSLKRATVSGSSTSVPLDGGGSLRRADSSPNTLGAMASTSPWRARRSSTARIVNEARSFRYSTVCLRASVARRVLRQCSLAVHSSDAPQFCLDRSLGEIHAERGEPIQASVERGGQERLVPSHSIWV